jgi:hypothetical protein
MTAVGGVHVRTTAVKWWFFRLVAFGVGIISDVGFVLKIRVSSIMGCRSRLMPEVGVSMACSCQRRCGLPALRTSEFEEVDARVSTFGTFTAKRILYGTYSRLIGHRLKVLRYQERIEDCLGGVRVMEAPRGRVESGQHRGKMIDYRHLLPALRRKPGAFARWVFRDEMFPRSEYRHTWECLQ